MNVAQNGYAVEFDEFQGNGDPSPSYIAVVQTVPAGLYNHLSYFNTNATFDNVWHQVQVQFFNDTTIVTLDGTQILSQPLAYAKTYRRLLFGGSTGGGVNNHEIDDVIIRQYVAPEPVATLGTAESAPAGGSPADAGSPADGGTAGGPGGKLAKGIYSVGCSCSSVEGSMSMVGAMVALLVRLRRRR